MKLRKVLSLARPGLEAVNKYGSPEQQAQAMAALKVLDLIEARRQRRIDKRPELLIGTAHKICTGCGHLYVTINRDELGQPVEVFAKLGKAGGCAASQLEAVGRLITTALREGADLDLIIDQLKSIRCPSSATCNGQDILSCADAIAKVLERK